jgi:hypothetical protein
VRATAAQRRERRVGTPFNAWMYGLRRRAFRQAVHQFLPPRDRSLLRKVGFRSLEGRPMFAPMNYPVDSTSKVHGRCRRVLVLAMAAWNPLGAVLYPLELALVARLQERNLPPS